MRIKSLLVDAAAWAMAGERLLALAAPNTHRRLTQRFIEPRQPLWRRLLNFAATHPRETAKFATWTFAGGVLLAGLMTKPKPAHPIAS